MLNNILVYTLIYVLIPLCTCVKERKVSLKFLHQSYIWSYNNQFSTDLAFWHEGHWVGGSGTLCHFVTQTVGRFDMWVTPYTSILTLAKLKYFMSKDLSNKTL